MNFEQSTQARYWMYDEASISKCRAVACEIQSNTPLSGSMPTVKARKHACGHFDKCENEMHQDTSLPFYRSVRLSPDDQETLVRFHAHQIQRLVGPRAILHDLRRSASALSTAIMLFRRFYLSNSVIDFHPRNIAVASALLSVKVECEKDLEITSLAHATFAIHHKAQNAVLCRGELRAVNIDDIEEAERALLEGLDFRLRCHHPHEAIKELTTDITYHIMEGMDNRTDYNRPDSKQGGYESPRSVTYCGAPSRHRLSSVCDRALAVAQAALVYTDVCFFFPPREIAFAAVAIALEGRVGSTMQVYLNKHFHQYTEDERDHFEDEVSRIIASIANCPSIDMDKFSSPLQRKSSKTTEHRAVQIRRVFSKAANIRRGVTKDKLDEQAGFLLEYRKRKQIFNENCLTPSHRFKVARVSSSRMLFERLFEGGIANTMTCETRTCDRPNLMVDRTTISVSK